MAINAEVTKNDGESEVSLIRRFQKRVQGAGLVQRMRGRRYFERPKSKQVLRKHTLKAIGRREKIMELIKLGKLIPTERKFGRRK